MNVQVLFFASLKEQLGSDGTVVDVPFVPATVAGLRQYLCQNYPGFEKAWVEVGCLRAAVNKEMAQDETPVSDSAEVAFFPPVTGG